MSSKTLEYWENIANNINSFINTENDGHCLEIIALSYNHLPIHLKPCLLYIASFKEDAEFNIFTLSCRWVADGFLKPTKDKTLEEVASEYLNDLINRNLIMVQRRRGSLTFHDLLREFCLREAHSEGFLCVLKDVHNLPQRLESERRLVCSLKHIEFVDHILSQRLARSLICNSGQIDFTSSRLLRVLVVHSLDVDVRHLVNLRYLVCQGGGIYVSRFLSSIPSFWNLETLVLLRGSFTLPYEFWELTNLRHLVVKGSVSLPEPTDTQPNDNLQTLVSIRNFIFSDDTVNKIPNLKDLVISYDPDHFHLSHYLTNLARLRKLETLTCFFVDDGIRHMCAFNDPRNLTFATNLRSLTLNGSGIPWENMTIIGSLPNLQVLSLYYNAFCGKEWNSTEGNFQCLKSLSIINCRLRIWRAESYHFPRLEHLQLLFLDLEEIPLGIGEVITLQSIKLYTEKMSAVISAKELLDERHNHGDDDLLIRGCCHGKSTDDARELENFATHNFQVTYDLLGSDNESEEDTGDAAEDPGYEDGSEGLIMGMGFILFLLITGMGFLPGYREDSEDAAAAEDLEYEEDLGMGFLPFNPLGL